MREDLYPVYKVQDKTPSDNARRSNLQRKHGFKPARAASCLAPTAIIRSFSVCRSTDIAGITACARNASIDRSLTSSRDNVHYAYANASVYL